jgi:RsiW-degrading membrane proteinase PrsW (M82 family)
LKNLDPLWENGMNQDQVEQLAGKRGGWWRVLLTGLLAYFAGIIVLVLTDNPILFPTVVMIGCFTVPVTYVAFFYERRQISQLNMPTTARSFLYGGVLGVFASALLEPLLIRELSFSSFFLIGLIEEFTKILGILVIAGHRRHDRELDGLILGAAAGMGFASLESAGYAFIAFLNSHGSLSATVGLTLLRGFLSPVGHGTWTAILAGVLFRESDAGRFRFNRRLLGAYLTVSILHGLWDGLPVLIAALLLPGLDILIGQACVGGIGFFLLWRLWREAVGL